VDIEVGRIAAGIVVGIGVGRTAEETEVGCTVAVGRIEFARTALAAVDILVVPSMALLLLSVAYHSQRRNAHQEYSGVHSCCRSLELVLPLPAGLMALILACSARNLCRRRSLQEPLFGKPDRDVSMVEQP
jgi:hypothetical protein